MGNFGYYGNLVLLASSGGLQSERGGFARQLVRIPIHPIIIESFASKGKLLKRKEITSKLAEAFNAGYNTFLFSGNSMFEGAMVIQTQEHKEGQPFTIEELVTLFVSNNKKNLPFNICLDCCFAGKMAVHLKNFSCIPDDIHFQIFCSSGPSDVSLDLNNYGGLLITWFWALQTQSIFLLQENKSHLAKIFSSTNPFKQFKLSEEQIKAQSSKAKPKSSKNMSETSRFKPESCKTKSQEENYCWPNQIDQNGWTNIRPLQWTSKRQQSQGHSSCIFM